MANTKRITTSGCRCLGCKLGVTEINKHKRMSWGAQKKRSLKYVPMNAAESAKFWKENTVFTIDLMVALRKQFDQI